MYLGMRKDYILTPEQKQTKKQRLEENRLLRSTTIDQETSVNTTKLTTDHYSVREIDIFIDLKIRMGIFSLSVFLQNHRHSLLNLIGYV